MKKIYIENDDYKSVIVSGLNRKDILEVLLNLKGIVQVEIETGELMLPVYVKEDIYTILWTLKVRHPYSETLPDGEGGFIFKYK